MGNASNGTFVAEKPDVKRIWKRWEPRFIGAGVDYNTLQKLKGQIADWDDWCRAWSAEAADREAFGDAAMERGRTLTAAESWAGAASLFHFGGMFFVHDMEQFWESHRRKLAAFAKAAPYLCPPAERIEVMYQGVAMPGYLRKPLGVTKPPIAIFFNGFEGVKEEGEQRLKELLARGLATLTWDGPGRGESWEGIPMTGEYGPATSAVIDYLETRDDVDASRIGATGPNRGAFVAAKAAAYDSRIKACAFTSPGYDRRKTPWEDTYQVLFDMHLFHVKTPEELRARIYDETDLTLEGDAEKIRCPVLLIAGGRDDQDHYSGTHRFFEELQGPKEWMVFPDAERNGNNVPFKVRPMLADFLAEHLGGNTRGC